MKKVALFDVKPYDKDWFEKLKGEYGIEVDYIVEKLSPDTVAMAEGYDGVVPFVNDNLSAKTIEGLINLGIGVISMRCAGYNNLDLESCKGKIKVFRVPAYSPHAVAEHAIALLMCMNRKLHEANNRILTYDFSLSGLMGIDLVGRTAGVFGTGKIGQVFINICKGLGMKVIAHDIFPVDLPDVEYVTPAELFKRSDVISLHCPQTPDTHHLINKNNLALMKDGVFIINTGRGGLVNAGDLLEAIERGKVAGAGLDVYENEAGIFFEDRSKDRPDDAILKKLIDNPKVLITAHQAYLTQEALKAIAEVTFKNLTDFFNGKTNENEV